MSDTGLLYPANVLFLLLDPGRALRGVLAFNLIVAGVFTYALCRELGAGRLGALAGALAFELGNACSGLTLWTPMAAGPFVWLPAAMLCTERLLRRPSLRSAAALGCVLAIALLPGYPQPVFFICQLVALRVMWEVASGRVERPVGVFFLAAVGVVLAPLLAAVQFVPALEVARESVRSTPLNMEEISPQGFLGWGGLQKLVVLRSAMQPFIVAPALAALAAFGKAATRRHAVFHLGSGTIYLLLALGTATPLFRLYARLPLGKQFHDPIRFLWMTSFSLAILAGLGVDAIAAGRAADRRAALGTLVGIGVLGVAFTRLGGGLWPAEWPVVALAVASCLVWATAPARRYMGSGEGRGDRKARRGVVGEGLIAQVT